MARPATMFSMSSMYGGGGVALPNPDQGSAEALISTLVNSGRNAEGVVTAQKIGRDNNKTTMKWNYLEKGEWERMVRFWDSNFFFYFTYYSAVSGGKITRKFYVGDRKCKPFNVDRNGIPTAYVDCSANVIDCGE